MKVPKCKDCKYFRVITPKSWEIKTNKSYECTNVRINSFMFANILAKDIKTSPKWCPKRVKEVVI